MNLEQLLELLDLEDASQFEYFENFADLVESDEEVDEDVLYQLFEATDGKGVAEIISNYFEEISQFMPDESTDFVTLMENIKNCLVGLARNKDQDNNLIHFAGEVAKFKEWYTKEGTVVCQDKIGESVFLSIRDAIVEARVGKLENTETSYDFSRALDYELEEFLMDIGELMDYEFDDEEEMDEYFEEHKYDLGDDPKFS